jgi:hypothetical protein
MDNMAYVDENLNDPTKLFNTVLYTGNGSSQSISGVGFQPDWIWLKSRSGTYGAYNPQAYDVVRGFGATKDLTPASTAAEGVDSGAHGYISAVGADGFTLTAGSTNSNQNNGSSTTYVAWNWLAGGSSSSNSDGSISSNVSANTTSGFSIVSYTGTGSNATIGHGLGAVPKMIINKSKASGEHWGFYHASMGNGKALALNLHDAAGTNSSYWNNTTPTSSVWSVGTSPLTNHSNASISYLFAEKQGFSKFGSYTGNNSNDGNFIWLGFRPAWILFKSSDSGQHWHLIDSKRETFNDDDAAQLSPNNNSSEATVKTDRGTAKVDFLSNGFKLRSDGSSFNGTNAMIYMAFAEAPFVNSNGVPCNAR